MTLEIPALYPIINTSEERNLTMASGQSSELQSAIALVKTLTNAQLKDILRDEGLAVSGVKAALQIRIIECLYISFPPNVRKSSADDISP